MKQRESWKMLEEMEEELERPRQGGYGTYQSRRASSCWAEWRETRWGHHQAPTGEGWQGWRQERRQETWRGGDQNARAHEHTTATERKQQEWETRAASTATNDTPTQHRGEHPSSSLDPAVGYRRWGRGLTRVQRPQPGDDEEKEKEEEEEEEASYVQTQARVRTPAGNEGGCKGAGSGKNKGRGRGKEQQRRRNTDRQASSPHNRRKSQIAQQGNKR